MVTLNPLPNLPPRGKEQLKPFPPETGKGVEGKGKLVR
jgi:hypothetical protein